MKALPDLYLHEREAVLRGDVCINNEVHKRLG
jgi:hypothetical protein